MARGFGASESRASLKGGSSKALEKALKGITEIPGILLDYEIKALEKSGLISVKDFVKESPENRDNIAKAIQAGIRDFEKNGLMVEDVSAEESDPEAIVLQDRADRIREQVLEALIENDQRKNPDNRGFAANESAETRKAGGFESPDRLPEIESTLPVKMPGMNLQPTFFKSNSRVYRDGSVVRLGYPQSKADRDASYSGEAAKGKTFDSSTVKLTKRDEEVVKEAAIKLFGEKADKKSVLNRIGYVMLPSDGRIVEISATNKNVIGFPDFYIPKNTAVSLPNGGMAFKTERAAVEHIAKNAINFTVENRFRGDDIY